MNEQPEYLEVVVMTFGFILLVIYYSFDAKNHWKFSDKFTIAEIVEEEPVVSVTISHDEPSEAPKTKKVKKKSNVNAARKPSKQSKPAQPRNHNGYTDLQQDCFEALKSLGMKTARERKYIVSAVFNEHNPSTVQDFLKLALSRGC